MHFEKIKWLKATMFYLIYFQKLFRQHKLFCNQNRSKQIKNVAPKVDKPKVIKDDPKCQFAKATIRLRRNSFQYGPTTWLSIHSTTWNSQINAIWTISQVWIMDKNDVILSDNTFSDLIQTQRIQRFYGFCHC